MNIHLIAAARPNFMKIAPLFHALEKERWADPTIIHTGQHYDLNMSDVFFQDLGLPEPHIHLGVGSGTHAQQTGQVMIAYEKILYETRPDLVIVAGDVNSTVACTLAAVKISYQPANSINPINTLPPDDYRLSATPAPLNFLIKTAKCIQPGGYEPNSKGQRATDHRHGRRPIVGHLEAGLRSFDRTMPEEINRLVTDALADILWTPSPDGDENLIKEGVSPDKIQRVGNIMIDSLEMLRDKIQIQEVFKELGLRARNYGLVTLHRPANVDDPKILEILCTTLIKTSKRIPLVFPIHPRTRKNAEKLGLMTALKKEGRLSILEPLNYIRFMNLVFNCRFALTDSGGIQEETTYLGIPCLTLRPNTERPITIQQGTNRLCTPDNLMTHVEKVLSGKIGNPPKIELWDGLTAERIVDSIRKRLL